MGQRLTVCGCVFSVVLLAFLSLPFLAQEKTGPLEITHVSDTVAVDVNLINVPFTVLDSRGHAVQHLPQDAFRVYENGVPQVIAGFRVENDGEPASIAMLIDSSYSVSRSLEVEKQAATRFFRILLESGDNRALAATFSNDTALLQDYTSDPDLLARRIHQIRAGGGTRLIDGIQAMIDQKLAGQAGRRVLIIISDGDDNLSRIPLAKVIENAHHQNVVIYTVEVESELARLSSTVSIPYLDPTHGPAILKQLAEETGGCTFQAKRSDDFANALRHIAAALRAHYTIQYQSNQSAGNDAYRRIRIEVANSKYQVHSRDGYYPASSTAVAR